MINSTEMTITPAKAKAMLELNEGNRKLNSGAVDYLATQILNGNWKLNGESIKMGKDKLIDGQHRLSAVVKAGKSIKTIVMTGVDNDVFDTVDTGRNRKTAEIFAMRGEKNTTSLGGLIKLLHRYYNVGWSNRERLSSVDMAKFIESFAGVRSAVATKHRSAGIFPPRAVHFSLYVFREIDPVAAEYFVDAMCTGANLDRRSPIHALRTKLINANIAGTKFNPDAVICMTFKAWNFYREDKKISKLFYKKGETIQVAI